MARQVRREYAFQTVAIIYIRRVLVPPAEAFAIVNESELTQNARARAKSRGVIDGVSDILAIQQGRAQFLELKWGNNKPSDGQLEFKERMATCGIRVSFCWTIAHIYSALADEDFALHGNAYNLVAEFEERVDAAVRKAELRATKPYDAAPRDSRSRTRRGAGIYAKVLLGG